MDNSTNDKRVKNIIFLTKYGDLAASSRLRAYQYKDKIDSPRLSVELQSLFSNKYLEKKFNNKSISLFYILYLYLKRLFFLLKLYKYEVIIIHCELFPYIPPLVEWALFKLNKKIYFDYDDAIFHNYDLSENLYIKFFLSNKIKYSMKMSAGVIAGNQYILNYAQNAGAKKILKLPTVIDLDKYASDPPSYKKNNNFTVGWIGSPSTSKYLEILAKPLAEIGLKIPVLLYIVGADPKFDLFIPNIEMRLIPWSEKIEQNALRDFDVGVMPLYDNSWERGKSAFKLIQYMASFLPVVASNVGMNSEIIHNDVNGFVASNSKQWVESLMKIYDSNELREKMGKNGRKLIEQEYTIQSRLNQFENFIN